MAAGRHHQREHKRTQIQILHLLCDHSERRSEWLLSPNDYIAFSTELNVWLCVAVVHDRPFVCDVTILSAMHIRTIAQRIQKSNDTTTS